MFSFFFFKQKTAYEMRISDWSSDVCSSDLRSLIWMIRACTGAHGPRAESLLLTVATGDDDSTGIGDIKHGERAKEPDWKRAFTLGSDLNGTAINSARGSALEMLGGMCWSSKETFAKYRPILDPIIGAPAAAHVHSSLSGDRTSTRLNSSH